MPFNPSQGQWGNEVGNSARPIVYLITGRNTSGTDATQLGRAIGYARGVLRLECGRTEISVAPNPGPWVYDTATATAIRDLKTFFGVPNPNNVLDAKAYELLDVCVIF
jgi:hypothetical protein